ncbi:NAD-dependent epimerase/dehydratase family protein [Gloeobacter kilaueensis]|uniref:NAD-dependent epimerase/dehydratase n=1 Tax=Gloeobacter kilaueensis (strain ATCC BAA-2537 / CCAP 1431/1 / ULC 316 / JS1) TaxID=1183438 RepID=U5QEK5_GLOK1|nr:NAD-dependent epimerase/dehydratase family protein [Gloeobacter kilaueensis]AGY57377.1 NAD-dependent epimerase/dehydratase [Gloeobacter kilaueensis JS1]
MATLITGASGFLGKQLALRLLKEGRAVTYLGRRAVGELDQWGATYISGDITDAGAVERAMAGVKRVFHLAAWFDLGIREPEKMERINVGGTRNVLGAALAHKVERVVYSSTVGIFHPTSGIATEKTPVSEKHLSHYTRTKAQAHAVALELFAQGCPVVIALPGYVYGPASDGLFGRLVRQFLAGELPAVVGAEQRSSYVHVDDVVEGLLLVEAKGVPGQSYILAGEAMNLREWFKLAAEVSAKAAPALELPLWALYPVAFFSDWFSSIGGPNSVITREALDYLQGDLVASAARAERELQWHSRPLVPAMAETIRWYQEHPGS